MRQAVQIEMPIIMGPPRAAIRRDERNVLHVVALSGGKDSTAMALELRERNPGVPFLYLCTPTGDELPDMFAHWARLGQILGSRVWELSKGESLHSLIKMWDALPNWRQRWCTRMLKIEPYSEWLQLQVINGPVRSYVGLRADEEEREGGDYSNIPNVNMVFPMRDWGWGLQDVYDRLDRDNVVIPRRTDCARCYHQSLYEWYLLWRDHLDIYLDAERQETTTGHTFRSPSRDTQPASLGDLRRKFESGYVPKPRKRTSQCRVCAM